MNTNLQFETYISERGRADGKPTISILKRGGFGFSKSFFANLLKTKPTYVNLSYAQDMEYIYVGFIFSDEKKNGSLKIYYPKAGNGLILSTGYFKKYGISTTNYKGMHMAEKYEGDSINQMYIIKLKK